VAKIPTSPKERRAWLAERTKKRSGNIDSKKQSTLVKWYGENAAKKVKYVESFEVAEYGFQPSEENIRNFFPMLKN